MERSFKKEVQALRLGDGETFRGEGILAVTKALLQSGVTYVGGYQGAPVSHLLDVLVDAEDLLAELGVHVETCTNEASAAAMLGASINYPLRGAVTWKSIVGTNVAADALSNLASPGVIGGAMIILGEDYGEGASVIQERSYAYALKSSMWLLDPRPDLPTIVRMVEKGFELSEASHAPVMLELRIRACHVTGEFAAKDNRKARRILRPQPHRRPAALRLRAARASAGDLRAGAAQGRGAAAGGAEIHPRAQAQRGHRGRPRRYRHHRDGRPHQQRAARAGAARPRRPVRQFAHPDLCASTWSIRWCRRKSANSAPASARCWWSRKAIPTTSSRRSTSNCAAPTSRPACSARARCRRPANTPPTCCSKGLAAFVAETRRRASMPTRSRRAREADRWRTSRRRRRGGRRAAAAAADVLHRLPGAAGVLRDQADAARARPDPYQRRYRLPFVRDLRAVQPGQLDPRLRHVARQRRRGRAQHGNAAPDRGDGRRRLLAQRR